jgi:drug/metabolite transporter (DMT)-like permease
MHRRLESTKPILIIILGVIAVSTSSPLIRLAQREASSFVIAAFRLILASLILAPFAINLIKKEKIRLTKKQIVSIGAAGLFLAIHFISWITSLEYTSITSSAVLVTTTPLWVAIFSPIFLKEKTKPLLLIGVGVALLGGILVGINDRCIVSQTGLSCSELFAAHQSTSLWGNFLAVAGAWCAAGYLMVGRSARATIHVLVYTFLVYGCAAILLTFVVIISGDHFMGYSGQTYLLMAALGIIPQLIGHSSFNWALGHVQATIVSTFLLGEPIGTSILAMMIIKEYPTALEICGGGIILIGLLIVIKSGQKND